MLQFRLYDGDILGKSIHAFSHIIITAMAALL